MGEAADPEGKERVAGLREEGERGPAQTAFASASSTSLRVSSAIQSGMERRSSSRLKFRIESRTRRGIAAGSKPAATACARNVLNAFQDLSARAGVPSADASVDTSIGRTTSFNSATNVTPIRGFATDQYQSRPNCGVRGRPDEGVEHPGREGVGARGIRGGRRGGGIRDSRQRRDVPDVRQSAEDPDVRREDPEGGGVLMQGDGKADTPGEVEAVHLPDHAGVDQPPERAAVLAGVRARFHEAPPERPAAGELPGERREDPADLGDVAGVGVKGGFERPPVEHALLRLEGGREVPVDAPRGRGLGAAAHGEVVPELRGERRREDLGDGVEGRAASHEADETVFALRREESGEGEGAVGGGVPSGGLFQGLAACGVIPSGWRAPGGPRRASGRRG